MNDQQPQKTQTSNFVFHIARTFDAPRDRVWQAWTEPKQMMQWFGPTNSEMTACTIDLRAGGTVRYSLDVGGIKMHGQWAYLEVKEPEKIVSIVSFVDEKGHKTRHPLSPHWPIDIYSLVTFAEEDGKTTVSVEWSAYHADDISTKTFEDGMAGMQQGWGGTLDRLGAFFSGA